MARKRQDTVMAGTISRLLKILLPFLLLGAAGAFLGTKVIMLRNGGACVQGVEAGAVFLIVGACLAAPATLLLLRTGARDGGPAQAIRGAAGKADSR